MPAFRLPRLTAIALTVAALLTACSGPPPRPSFPDIRFTSAPPIRLHVAAIDVIAEFQPSFHEPEVDHLFPVPPARAVENWAQDRLRPVGGPDRARFIIRDASVREVVLPKSQGLRAAITDQPAERYDATVEVRLDLVDPTGRTERTVSARAMRSQTVLEGISPNERDRTWYDMTTALMGQLDQQLEMQIRSNFFSYIDMY